MALNLKRGSKVTEKDVETEENEALAAEAEALKQREEADAAAAALAASKAKPDEGATLVPPKPIPPARLRATKYDIVCPHTSIRVPTDGTRKKVPISTWLKSQIDVGLIEYIDENAVQAEEEE